MAQIYKCDFCGMVSTDMAAEVYIRPVGTGFAEIMAKQDLVNERSFSQMDSIKRDCCKSCFSDKFIQSAPLVLEGKWQGED